MTGLTHEQDRAIQGFVDQLHALSRRVARSERSHDAAIGLGAPVTDAQGNVLGQIGGNPGARAMVEPDPVPPTPAAPGIEPAAGVAVATLTNLDEDGEPAPSTVVGTCVHASLTPGFEPSAGTLRVAAAPVTGEVVLPVAAGVWHVRTVWVTRTGTESEPSAEVVVDIEPLVDTDDIEATLQTARDELASATAQAEAGLADLDRLLSERINEETGGPVALDRLQPGAANVSVLDALYSQLAVVDRLTARSAWIGGALLRDGAVTAEKITATEALTAKVAQFLNIEAGMIKANAFQGQEFVGGTFTGAAFQSHASPTRGMKLRGDGLHAWDANGNETTRLDGLRNLLIGRVQTGLWGQPQIVLAPVAETGNPSVFFSDSGSLAGTQAAIWLAPDSSLVLRPNITAGQNWVSIAGGGLRSGNTAGSDSWAITHSGVIRGRQLELVEGLRSGTSRWSIASDGDANFNFTKVWQSLTVEGNGYFNGNDIRMTSLPAGSFNPNVGWASTPLGQLYRITSNRRIKANIRDLEWDEDALLSLRPRTWYDRSLTEYQLGKDAITDTEDGPVVDEQAARQAGLSRIPGLVAEEVEALGLSELVTYDTDPDTGQRTLSGVNYDRLAAALIPVLRGQRKTIATLEDRVARLEALIDR